MDPVIDRMDSILQKSKSLRDSGEWNQPNQLDLHQEMEKQRHIFNHIGRASKNPMGRIIGYTGGAIGGAILVSMTIRNVQKFNPVTYVTMLGGATVGAIIGNYITSRFFGDRKEYKVFLSKNKRATDILKEFEALF